MTDYVLFEQTNIVSGAQTNGYGSLTLNAHYVEARSPEEAASMVLSKRHLVDEVEVFAVDDDSGRQFLISCGKFSRSMEAVSV